MINYTTNKNVNKELDVILNFKQWIEETYQDLINNEIIETYCLTHYKTKEEKEILERRFL